MTRYIRNYNPKRREWLQLKGSKGKEEQGVFLASERVIAAAIRRVEEMNAHETRNR